ncbi:MAG: thioredoxin [Gammaproteobacteria bacterium]|nr:MAG: thioredoxin [Gammaproteobacteria bacterium]
MNEQVENSLGNNGGNIVEINEKNFQQLLIEESAKRLVVVDFWADWCAPCKALMPILEKLANEYNGRFLLAKVNADEQQQIAGQFGIRSLPTVIFMKDGQPIDAFQGAESEAGVRAKLEEHLGSGDGDALAGMLAGAQQKLADGNFEGALADLQPAYADAKRYDIAMSLAYTLMQLNRCDEAQTVMDAILLEERTAEYEQLHAQIELKREASKSPEIKVLEEQLNANPDNIELAYELAVKFSQNNHFKESLVLLFTVLKEDKEFRDGGAKKAFLDVLAALGKGDPLAVEYQRKFFNLLY